MVLLAFKIEGGDRHAEAPQPDSYVRVVNLRLGRRENLHSIWRRTQTMVPQGVPPLPVGDADEAANLTPAVETSARTSYASSSAWSRWASANNMSAAREAK